MEDGTTQSRHLISSVHNGSKSPVKSNNGLTTSFTTSPVNSNNELSSSLTCPVNGNTERSGEERLTTRNANEFSNGNTWPFSAAKSFKNKYDRQSSFDVLSHNMNENADSEHNNEFRTINRYKSQVDN